MPNAQCPLISMAHRTDKNKSCKNTSKPFTKLNIGVILETTVEKALPHTLKIS
ncbi:MAG: hypothetical protein F6J93_38645 [Oscillatoria sp. SIO1A7]|nr:hypothetical protein [Oscillatoria sp. SIO1A7]